MPQTDNPKRRLGCRLVLFDLDGTFADTAPDLAQALNRTLQTNGRTALDLEQIRPQVSHGGAALVRLGFGIGQEHPEFEVYRRQLLDHYRQNLSRSTRLFPGTEELLHRLEQLGILWGIVTNKPAWLTDPLMDQLGIADRAACVVSGDTTEHRKPHPLPILHACRMLEIDPTESLYIGDAQRDIEAGIRAGATTLTALFGYLNSDDRPEQWGAAGAIAHPLEVLDWIQAPC